MRLIHLAMNLAGIIEDFLKLRRLRRRETKPPLLDLIEIVVRAGVDIPIARAP